MQRHPDFANIVNGQKASPKFWVSRVPVEPLKYSYGMHTDSDWCADEFDVSRDISASRCRLNVDCLCRAGRVRFNAANATKSVTPTAGKVRLRATFRSTRYTARRNNGLYLSLLRRLVIVQDAFTLAKIFRAKSYICACSQLKHLANSLTRTYSTAQEAHVLLLVRVSILSAGSSSVIPTSIFHVFSTTPQ